MSARLIGSALVFTLFSGSLHAQTSARAAEISTPRLDARFKIFPTKNLWVFLLLDSNNGRVWQVHYAVSDSAFAGQLSLNEKELAPPAAAHSGRFSLRETENIFTFLLLDQDDGRVWQVQWSNNEANRGIVRALAAEAP